MTIHNRVLVEQRDRYHNAIQRAVDLYNEGKLQPNPFYERDALIDNNLVEGIVQYLELEYESEIRGHPLFHRNQHSLESRVGAVADANEDPPDGITLVPPRLVDWPIPQQRALVQMIDVVNLELRALSKAEFEKDEREIAEKEAAETARRANLTEEQREAEDLERRRQEYAMYEGWD
jgi:hypothetical protein